MYARRYRHNPPLTERQLRLLKQPADRILRRIQGAFPEDQGFQDFVDRNRLNLLMTIRKIQNAKVPTPKTVAEAIETIQDAADYLADLPPPGPEWMGLKDDVGLSASTDGPIRWYVANVNEETPLETHLGAADYLRVHQKQIGPERWRAAFDVLRAATDVDIRRAKQGLTQAGRAALDPKGTVRALGDGSVAYKFRSRFTRDRLQDLGIAGDKLSFDRDTAEWIIRPGAIGDAIDALRVLLANDVLADQTQAMLDDGMIGMAAVPTIPTIQEHDGVTWRWDKETKRVALQNLRLSKKILGIQRLYEDRDYKWKKKGSDLFLFIEPAALRKVMADRWISKNVTGASAFPYIKQWLDNSPEKTVFVPSSTPSSTRAAVPQAGPETTSFDGVTWKWEKVPTGSILLTEAVVETIAAALPNHPELAKYVTLKGREGKLEYPAHPYVGKRLADILDGLSRDKKKRLMKSLQARAEKLRNMPLPSGYVVIQGTLKGLSTEALADLGLKKGTDYLWKRKKVTPKGGRSYWSYSLFMEPSAIRTIAQSNLPKATVFQAMIPWMEATRGAALDLKRVEGWTKDPEAQRIAFERKMCEDISKLWKAVEPSDIEDPELRAKVYEINNAIRWPAGIEPKPFQMIGIAAAVMRGGRLSINDDTGLGKTFQSIGFLKYDVPKHTPAVIICPSSVQYNWKSEINRFAPELNPYVAESTKESLPPMRTGMVLILTWDGLKRHTRDIMRARTVIFDESHYAKEFTAARTKAAIRIAHSVPHVLLLTATAFPNRPIELFAQLNMLDPDGITPLFQDLRHSYPPDNSLYTAYGREYADGHYIDYANAWDFKGASNLQDLREYVSCLGVARKKSDPRIANLFPPKTRKYLWVPNTGEVKKAYDNAKRTFLTRACNKAKARVISDFVIPRIGEQVRKGNDLMTAAQRILNSANRELPNYSSPTLVELSMLLQDVGKIKVDIALREIEKYLAQAPPDEPLVVFANYKDVVKQLGAGLAKRGITYTTIDGKVSGKKKNQRQEEFRAGKYQVLIGTLAAREGLNLQNSSDALFVERFYVPGWEEQMEGRIHRIGGPGRPVTARYLMISDTVDEDIHAMVEEKRGNFEGVYGEQVVGEEAPQREVESAIRAALLRELGDEIGTFQGCTFTVQDLVNAYKAFKALED